MTGHDAIHKLSQALAFALLAEKNALSLPLSMERTELLHFIREIRYCLEIVDKGYGLQLINQKEQL